MRPQYSLLFQNVGSLPYALPGRRVKILFWGNWPVKQKRFPWKKVNSGSCHIAAKPTPGISFSCSWNRLSALDVRLCHGADDQMLPEASNMKERQKQKHKQTGVNSGNVEQRETPSASLSTSFPTSKVDDSIEISSSVNLYRATMPYTWN